MKNRKLRRRKARSSPGASPGTLVMTTAGVSRIKIISYNAEHHEEREIGINEVKVYLQNHSQVTWFDVQGVGDEKTLRQFAELFSIHPLALEDVVHIPQRPKIEEYDSHIFVIARMVALKSEENMEAEQLSLFLGSNYVLTFQEPGSDCLEPVRERLRRKGGIHRRSGADYLCYSLLDAVVDNYFPVLEEYGEYLERLEEETVGSPSPHTLSHIHLAKRELLDLRRVLWPQREAFNQLIRSDSTLISRDVIIFLRDCYDHSVQVMDMVESYREITSGLHDVYLSSISNRTNEIMKFLTIISTVFIPLTFIAGVYGMNFKHMPELEWEYGYFYTLAFMFLIGASLFVYFYRKGWIGKQHSDLEKPVLPTHVQEKVAAMHSLPPVDQKTVAPPTQ